MQLNDKPQFLAVLNGLAAIKPGAKFTAEGLQMWWQAMDSWTIDAFRSAAAQLAKSCEFMPNPYHFEQLRKAGRKTSGEAWAEVLYTARSGDYRLANGQDTDQLIRAAVRAIGGYEAIAMSRTDQTQFLERRFAEHYDAIGEREQIRDAVPQITGPSRHQVAQLLEDLT